MKIGVTSQNFRTVTGHAGKARRFMVFEVAEDGAVLQSDRYDLPKDMSMHEHPHSAPHPIDDLNVLITGSCGEGFMQRMAKRGIKVIVTGETDPMKAVKAVATGEELAPPLPEDHEHDHDHDKDHCDCDHGHCDDKHDHDHDHDGGGCGCSCSSKGSH
ncbi:MAG: NifB/NifX family molybdenum-iron cluster-binding protein [Alphaproteobacteria bacterium]